jgi:mycothiol maleylpyruvate isomerase-like protein
MKAPVRGALPWWLATTLGRSYQKVTEVVATLVDADFERPTRCRGMTVGALLVHLSYDAERALIAFASPTKAPPDRDYVTYWRDFPGQGDPEDAGAEQDEADAGLRFTRAVAAAYEHPSKGLVRHWIELSEAAVRAAHAASARPDGRVTTQGHALAVPDFLATLVVEATVHHLDLIVDLAGAPEPDPEGIQLTARTLDGLFGPQAWDVIGWDLTTYVLKATGRLTLVDADLDMLGPHAGKLPLLG